MPFDKEHNARVRDPADFLADSFRRKVGIAAGVDLIAGKLKDDGSNGPMTKQAYRFDAAAFTADEAKAWCRSNGVRFILFEPAAGGEAQAAAAWKERQQFRSQLAASQPLANGRYLSTLQATDDGLGELRFVAAAEPEGGTDGLVRRRYRLFSADVDVCDSYCLWTCTPEAVLREGAPLWGEQLDARGLPAPVPVILSHNRETIPCGKVEAAAFVESDGFLPGGIEGTLAIDPQINPAVARAVETGLIRAVSSCIEFEWSPSHDGMAFNEFVDQLGDVVDGRRVVLQMSRICRVPEVSLCLYGAEPYSTTLHAAAPVLTGTSTPPVSTHTTAAGTPPAPVKEEDAMPHLAEIRAALGLPENTEPAAVTVAAVQALKALPLALARADAAESENKTLKAEIAAAQVVKELDVAQKEEGRFAPIDRPTFEALAKEHGIEAMRAAVSACRKGTVPVGVAQASGTPTIPAAPLVLPEPGLDPGLAARIQSRYGLAK